jgi:uncharacterized membrane protein required for colicin V production
MTNHIITISILLVILFFLIDGARKGLVRQIFEVVGLLAAFVGAYYVGHLFAGDLAGSVRLPHRPALIVSTVLVFIVIMILFHLMGLLFQKIVSVTVLGPVDRIGGAVFGGFKGVLFVSLICLIMFSVVPAGNLTDAIRANPIAAKIHPVLPRVYHFLMRQSSAPVDPDTMASRD